MTPLMFVYNIFLIMIYTCTMVLFFTLFVRNKKRSHLAITGLFFFYVLDNAIVYMTEFISSFANYYNEHLSDGSIFKTLILAAICFCYLIIKTSLSGRQHPPVHDWIIFGCLILWFLVIPDVTFSGNVWFYYIAEPIYLIYLCFSLFLFYLHNKEKYPEAAAKIYRYRHLMMTTALLSIAIMVEDAMVLLNLPSFSAMTHRIRQRNLMEDIQSLVFVGYSIYTFFLLQQKEEEETKVQEEMPEKAPETIPLPYLPVSELDIQGFSQEYLLTKRETQVLTLLLEDKSNHEMQDILVIAPGTVKNHIHNIYHKTSVSKRSQLLMKVSEFTMQDTAEHTDAVREAASDSVETTVSSGL